MILARLILGLLSLAPMTGYDLKKHFDATISHFWNADKAQIYRTLESLVRDGFAAVETVEQAGYPARQVHRITDAGHEALAEWLTSAPQPDAERNAFLGRVFFASQLKDADARKLLAARRDAATQYLAGLQEQLAGQRAAPVGDPRYFRVATLRNGIRHAQAELEWLQEIEGELA
ncbi:PadR family transcriptional regulator [Arthrobacter sp. NPDC058192]|uniref:PadR family transcriptional regulator n=1 Tax=Arthrobacter sp. NPDC058192 TaxID=3346372 RepID=UPI0036E04B77